MHDRAEKETRCWLAALPSILMILLLTGGCVAAKPEVALVPDEGLLTRAQEAYAQGDYEQSLTLYGQSLNEGETLAARLGAGVVMMAMDRPAQALREFNRVTVLAPGLAMGHVNKGLAQAALGRADAAEDAFTTALRLEPGNPVALNGMGCLLLDEGEMEQALVRFSEALKSAPDDPDIHYNRALGFHSVGLESDALDELDRSLALRPGSAAALGMRAVVRLKRDDAGGALEDLNAALTKEPENADFYYNRALVQHELMNYSEAVEDYTRAMVRNPAQAVYYANRGESRYLGGDKEGGCEDFSQACKLGRCERYDSLKAQGLCTK